MSITTKLLAAAASLGLASAAIPAAHAQSAPVKSIVLVHGGFVDGSGWEGVYKILKKDGYKVSIVQNPTTTLADDVAVTKRAIAAADGNVVLVGHSYGGVVITEAGTDPKVAGLVYITAFAPDQGESVGKLIAKMFQREPAIQARRDLRRFKQLMEAGEIATPAMNQKQFEEMGL